jgi:hypothetical protein
MIGGAEYLSIFYLLNVLWPIKEPTPLLYSVEEDYESPTLQVYRLAAVPSIQPSSSS